MTPSRDLGPYLSGAGLLGDDFGPGELLEWFHDEREGYAELARDRGPDRYAYHGLNRYHGFRLLRGRRFRHCLALGCARGDELVPIQGQLERVTALEPSLALRGATVLDVPVTWVEPRASGGIGIPTASVDLVTCLGVLHHIPNVSFVLSELGRVLEPGGVLLLREPIHSMGDWRYPRPGLTKRERGIPPRMLDAMLAAAELEVMHRAYCLFALLARVSHAIGIEPYAGRAGALLDHALSSAFAWNAAYDRRSPFRKIAPGAIFVVATKR